MIKKALNLYSAFGGNRKYWTGVSVTSVEINNIIARVYQDAYPNDELIIGDAESYLLDHYNEFDFIWSSRPCQTHTKMMKATRHKKKKLPDLGLYGEIIFLQHFFKGKWVVENVKPYYKPLIDPSQQIGRHLFWSNFEIPEMKFDNHKNFINADKPEDIESMKNWLGIKYEGNIYYNGNHSPGQVLRNCVHPEIGLHVFKAANK